MEVGSGAQPETFISDLLREGEETEKEAQEAVAASAAATAAAAAAAAEAPAAAAAAGSKRGKTAAAQLEVQADRGGRQGLSPAPACNLVLYDCCFEGLYFSRSGVVNLLMEPQGSSNSSNNNTNNSSSSSSSNTRSSSNSNRSEERRVGKECRSRWSPYH